MGVTFTSLIRSLAQTTPCEWRSDMTLMDDILKVLDRWDEWRILRTLPPRVAELEATVQDLNQKLNGKWPADVCRMCGERGLRLTNTLGPNYQGNMREHWLCEKCGGHDNRVIKPH